MSQQRWRIGIVLSDEGCFSQEDLEQALAWIVVGKRCSPDSLRYFYGRTEKGLCCIVEGYEYEEPTVTESLTEPGVHEITIGQVE